MPDLLGSDQPLIRILPSLRRAPEPAPGQSECWRTEARLRGSDENMSLPGESLPNSLTREWSRLSSFRDLTLTYEGDTEVLALRQPDISPRGMFISTAARFPEGAVLKLNFRLTRSDRAVSARGEVRYCLQGVGVGVGVGVEFIGMPAADQKAIRDEIRFATKRRNRNPRP